MKLTTVFLITIISLYGFLFFDRLEISAQGETATEYTLYVLDSCPHCEKLLEEIEPAGVLEALTITIVEVSTEQNKELLLSDLETCNDEDKIVPTLVVNSTCYQGASDVANVLFADSGINNPENEPTEGQESENIQQDNSTREATDATQIGMNGTTDEEPKRLSDVLEDESNKYERPEVNALQLLIIILSIGTFLFIGYTMIKKLQL